MTQCHLKKLLKQFSHDKHSACKSKHIFNILCAIFTLGSIIYGILLLFSLYRLDYTLAPHGILFRTVALLFPPLLWIAGTGTCHLDFHRYKLWFFILISVFETTILTGILFQLLSVLFLPHIMAIKTDAIFTKRMVLFLARIIVELPLGVFIYLSLKRILHSVQDEKSRDVLLTFKITNILGKRTDRKNVSYPLSIAKDMTNGKTIVISEKDRYLHTLVDGTSGTGKTSSTLLPAIKNDLDARCRAEALQLKDLHPFVENGKFIYNSKDNFFSINKFSPADDLNTSEKAKLSEKLEDLRLKHQVCGITVLAPDDSLCDDVARLCDARKIPYHRIDGTRDADGNIKSNWTGMNPFYVSPALSKDQKHQAIVKKAVVFSDVMQVITDLKGKADSYFTGLNRQMIANLSILVMNTVPALYRRQATPADLQALINNFDLLPEHVSKLETIDSNTQRYTFIIQYIKEDLLGKGRTKMEDQSRGTRNIINEFLLMPHSKEIYCSQTSIDFDRALMNSEVTLCNYDLASGDSNAVAFGLFFLLSFNNAVLSRPGTENTRTPHFFYIDELPVLLHSSLEKNFSLFRKFRVAMFCAIQTLDQFEKNELTKYLKGVVLGSAHIFVFGRSALSDMEIFSAMAGIEDKIEEQHATSETSLSGDSPTLSYSSRETPMQKNKIEEIDIRLRDFQEITLFTTRDGRPLPPIHAKVSFLKDNDWNPEPAQTSAFIDKFLSSYKTVSSDNETSAFAEDFFKNHKNILSSYTTKEESVPLKKGEPHPKSSKAADNSSSVLPNGSETIDDLFERERNTL